MHTEFWWGNLTRRHYLEDPGRAGRVILIWVFKMWDRGMDYIDLAKDTDGWPSVVNAVMNLRVP